jgi:hypothetical protein
VVAPKTTFLQVDKSEKLPTHEIFATASNMDLDLNPPNSDLSSDVGPTSTMKNDSNVDAVFSQSQVESCPNVELSKPILSSSCGVDCVPVEMDVVRFFSTNVSLEVTTQLDQGKRSAFIAITDSSRGRQCQRED